MRLRSSVVALRATLGAARDHHHLPVDDRTAAQARDHVPAPRRTQGDQMTVRRRSIALVAALALAAAGAANASALTITSFPITVVDTNGLVADHQGNVYVLSEHGPLVKLASDGTRTNVPYDPPLGPLKGPPFSDNLLWGPDDKLWLGCNGLRLCHVDPSGGGLIDSFDPVSGWLAAGPDGNLWYFDPAVSKIVRMSPTGIVTLIPGVTAGTLSERLVLGSDGNLWYPDSADDQLFRITPAGTLTKFQLPADWLMAGPMVAGPDGNLWVILDHAIGKLSVAGAPLARYPLATATPRYLAAGPDGDVWFTYRNQGGLGRITPSGHVSELSQSFDITSYPDLIVTAADGGIWVSAWEDHWVWRITPDPPTVTTAVATAVGTTSATLNGTVDPRGGPTSSSFEYGPSASYGATTAVQDDGDGDGAVLSAVNLAGLQSGTTYHYRLVAHQGMRTVYGADRTLTTASAAPIDPPKTPEVHGAAGDPVDADGDGYPSTIDCDDHDPRVNPGATDAPGDAIDQDCSGTPATYQRFSPPTDARWTTTKRGTQFTKLTVGAIPAGAAVTLTCKGRGCAFTSSSTHAKVASSRTSLLGRLKRSRLKRGAVLELRLALPGHITTIVRWTIGPPTRRTTTCLAPGARTAAPCP
jgi:hypothetical protein